MCETASLRMAEGGSGEESSSSASSLSLVSRDVYHTKLRVQSLERTVAALQEQVQGDQSFTAERLDNLEEQRRSIDRDLIVVRGRVESEAATQAARIARLEDQVAEIQHSLLARLESQSIAIARLSRRLQELEVQQR